MALDMTDRERRGQAVQDRGFKIGESVVCADLGGEVVLLNADTGTYFGLDAVGADIWHLVAEGASEDEILDRLLDDYDVEPERLRVDVSTFLARLADNGLVRVGAD